MIRLDEVKVPVNVNTAKLKRKLQEIGDCGTCRYYNSELDMCGAKFTECRIRITEEELNELLDECKLKVII